MFTCPFLASRYRPMGQGTNVKILPAGISIATLHSGIWQITIWWVQGSIQTTTYGPEQKHPYISSSTTWWTTMALGEGFQKMSALVSNNTSIFWIFPLTQCIPSIKHGCKSLWGSLGQFTVYSLGSITRSLLKETQPAPYWRCSGNGDSWYGIDWEATILMLTQVRLMFTRPRTFPLIQIK